MSEGKPVNELRGLLENISPEVRRVENLVQGLVESYSAIYLICKRVFYILALIAVLFSLLIFFLLTYLPLSFL